MVPRLHIERCDSGALSPARFEELVALCTVAYEEPFAAYFADIGPGVHLLGLVDDAIVSHVMWVPRDLHIAGLATLRSAYVEAVATHPAHQGHGHASALMAALAPHLVPYELAALSPSDHAWYARFGWETWQGPLSYRQGARVVATPDEELMIRRLPRTPAELDLHAPIACDWRPGEVW